MNRISILLILLLFGCAQEASPISQRITAQFDASTTDPIDLRLAEPTSWDRVCILTPYSFDEAAEEVLGFKWAANTYTSISGSDGINVLVFVKNQKVVAFTEQPRNKGDFSKIKPRCLPYSKAIVQRERGTDGWVYLVAN